MKRSCYSDKIGRWLFIFNLNFNVPRRTSLRSCSRRSPDSRFEFLANKTNTKGRFTEEHLKKKTSYRSLSYTKFQTGQNYCKGQYSLAHFWENCKKVKIEVTGPKKSLTFSDTFSKNEVFLVLLLFLHFFKKMCWSISTLPVILSLIKFCVAQIFWSNFT